MQVQIQKWGNSLAFRIPNAFVQETKLSQGAMVNLGIKEGRLIITPLVKKKVSLESLLMDVTKENIHGEESFGERQGQEIW
jgi:antitoxin MazE